MADTHPPLVRTRLSAMMFLEFFIWGGWGFALTGYGDNLGFTGAQLGWLIAIPALGAIISPLFIGLIADRFFPAQWMLALLHVIGGVCLIAAGFQKEFPWLMTLVMLYGLAFFPTIALANAIAFKHIPDPDKFPRIAVLGTIGWIVAVLLAEALGGVKAPSFLFQSGVGSIVLGIYALTLPHTPPKGAEAGGDAFGLSALKLLKDPTFLIFITCVFLISIPACGYFFMLATPMLAQRDYPSPLALTTLCQFAEIVFMFSMPWFVTKLGLKKVLLIGMVAWAIRYLCFIPDNFGLAIVGLLLHGFCYSFLYVAAYMYVDKRAPEDLKSSAQALLTFLLIGVAWFIGGKGAGFMMDRYHADVNDMVAVKVKTNEKNEHAKLPRWDDPEPTQTVFSYLDLAGNFKKLLGMEAAAPPPDLSVQIEGEIRDGKITMAELEAFREAGNDYVEVDGMRYSTDDLINVFRDVHQKLDLKEEIEEVEFERKQWMQVQVDKWGSIWFWPSVYCFAILLFFLVAFRDKPQEED